ncbi:PDR/VanB family oxidoreductase [Comamonas testosteroni]|nr:PDR/VanB family oxidoreductase [Comamonas testosteroni]WKL18636.1 PDR/VanB family oxidoreductase [Comamonas testosteroni]
MMPLRVASKRCIAPDVFLFELARADGAPLPAFDAGSHVTVLAPAGLTRRYSLCNSPRETDRFSIAIKREAAGGGGSMSLCDTVEPGDTLPTSLPLNYFPLAEGAQRHLLIAGGIGITPILAMAQELLARGAEFRIVYLASSRATAPFVQELLEGPLAGRVTLHCTEGDAGSRLDLQALLKEQAPGQHVYCCGPRRLMQAVREHSAHWIAGSVHFEDFGTSEQPQEQADQPFTVRLARSGRSFEVPCGTSILTVLRDAGIPAPASCESGTCGSCRTTLLSGCADHRDFVLDESEYDSEIMICVSRAKSSVIEIDL